MDVASSTTDVMGANRRRFGDPNSPLIAAASAFCHDIRERKKTSQCHGPGIRLIVGAGAFLSMGSGGHEFPRKMVRRWVDHERSGRIAAKGEQTIKTPCRGVRLDL